MLFLSLLTLFWFWWKLDNNLEIVGAGKRDAGIQGDHIISASLGNHSQMGREIYGDAEFWVYASKPNFKWKFFDEFLNRLSEIQEKHFYCQLLQKAVLN